jgi:MFS family permease
LSEQDPQHPPSGHWPPEQPWGAPPQWGSQQPGPYQPGADQPYGPPHQWSANPYPAPPPNRAGLNPAVPFPVYAAPPKPGVVPLRPLMFGEIMDGAFKTIRRNPKAMLGAGLVAQALGGMIAGVVPLVTPAPDASAEAWLANLSPSEATSLFAGVAGGFMLFGLVTVFISVVMQGAMVVPVARSILNRQTGFRQMWLLARGRAWALVRLAGIGVAAVLLGGALIALATVLLANSMGTGSLVIVLPLFLAFIAAIIWVSVKLTVAPAVIVVEDVGALDGIRRSWAVTRRSWWRVFGIVLVVSLLVGIIGQIVLIPLTLLTGLLTTVAGPQDPTSQAAALQVVVGVATAIVSAAVGAVAFAFQTSVMALLYMDLRMRNDGLDIALLRLLETGHDDGGIPGRGVPVYSQGRNGAGLHQPWPYQQGQPGPQQGPYQPRPHQAGPYQPGPHQAGPYGNSAGWPPPPGPPTMPG